MTRLSVRRRGQGRLHLEDGGGLGPEGKRSASGKKTGARGKFGPRAATATCSRRPLRAPWWRGAGARGGPSRPSAAPSGPSSAAPTTASTPMACTGVPEIPPLGEGSANIVWWSEMVGLQDPVLENDRVLDNQTVDCIVENLRGMSPGRRTAMIAQVLPFLGAFLAELLRAINLSQLPAPDTAELVEDDEEVLIQMGVQRAKKDDGVGNAVDNQAGDETSVMQKFDASIPFGSKLSQLQGHLNGFDHTQCTQVACHLRAMVQRLRQMAGVVSSQVEGAGCRRHRAS